MSSNKFKETIAKFGRQVGHGKGTDLDESPLFSCFFLLSFGVSIQLPSRSKKCFRVSSMIEFCTLHYSVTYLFSTSFLYSTPCLNKYTCYSLVTILSASTFGRFSVFFVPNPLRYAVPFSQGVFLSCLVITDSEVEHSRYSDLQIESSWDDSILRSPPPALPPEPEPVMQEAPDVIDPDKLVWVCRDCVHTNDREDESCGGCECKRSDEVMQPEFWACVMCSYRNRAVMKKCVICLMKRQVGDAVVDDPV